MVTRGYSPDLAYVHHAGFEGLAERAAPWLLATLRRAAIRKGSVVDLGCGSGAWAARASAAGHTVVGIDVSAGMLAIARRRARKATFRLGSFTRVALPRCDAVTALGEVLGYRFDPTVGRPALRRLFRRVFDALTPGGVFVFDVAGPGRGRIDGATSRAVAGDDWVVLVRRKEARGRLTREIATFRRDGRGWRCTEETHVLALYAPAEVLDDLAAAGFVAAQLRGYGRERFHAGHAGFLALKPRALAPDAGRRASRRATKTGRVSARRSRGSR